MCEVCVLVDHQSAREVVFVSGVAQKESKTGTVQCTCNSIPAPIARADTVSPIARADTISPISGAYAISPIARSDTISPIARTRGMSPSPEEPVRNLKEVAGQSTAPPVAQILHADAHPVRAATLGTTRRLRVVQLELMRLVEQHAPTDSLVFHKVLDMDMRATIF